MRENKIIYRTNGRNVVIDKYIGLRWFTTYTAEIEKDNFSAILPIFRVTKIGFDNIKLLMFKNPSYFKTLSDDIFKELIDYLVLNEILNLGYKKEQLEQDFIKRKSAIFVSEEWFTVKFFNLKSELVDLVKYNPTNNTILHNERIIGR